MAKKISKDTITPPREGDDVAAQIIDTPVGTYMRTKQYAYMLYTLTDRNVPLATSGIKPGAQRLLVSMLRDGVTPGSKPKKSAKLTSSATGAYHPHGQSSMYDSLVSMAVNHARIQPIEGIGSFGAYPGAVPAADRYTEARLSPLGYAMVKDIDKGAVPMRSTYDNENTEPVYLPTPVPTLIMNGAMGIAEAWATKIPAHNPREALDAVELVIRNPEASVSDILKVMPGPDWGTGGVVVGDHSGIQDYYATGRGSMTVRCTYHIEKRSIVITEVPPLVSVDTLINGSRGSGENSRVGLKDMARQNVIQGISDVSNYSDFEGMEIVIDVKRGYKPEDVMEDILRETDLETRYAASVVALDRNFAPRWWTMRELIDEFIALRDEVIANRAQFELDDVLKKIDRQRSLAAVALDKDMVAKIILDSRDKEAAAEQLSVRKFYYPADKQDLFEAEEGFITLSLDQGLYIVGMPLYRLTKADSLEVLAKLESLIARREELLHLINSRQARTDMMLAELDEARGLFTDEKYNRRTQLRPDIAPVQTVDKLPDEERFHTSWKFSDEDATVGDIGVEVPEGHVVWMVTDEGKAKRFEGAGLPLLIKTKPLAPSATILACGVTPVEDRWLCAITRGNNKSSTAKFQRMRLDNVSMQGIAGNGTSFVRLKDGDSVAAAFVAAEDDEVLIESDKSFKVIAVKDIPERDNAAMGIGVFKLKKDEQGVISAHVGREFVVNNKPRAAVGVSATPTREEVESWDSTHD